MFALKFGRASSFMLLLALSSNAFAAAPTAAISASPSEGNAPLAVFFDAGSSSSDSVSFLWNFGDGSVSTAKSLTHIYVVAGTYVATLTTTNAGGETGTSQVTITVAGTGEGPVTAGMNFRWSLLSANFNLKQSQAAGDSLNFTSAFNAVDLPGELQGLAASFSINDTFTITGILGQNGAFESADGRKPEFFFEVNAIHQTFNIFISKSDMKTALGLSGATNTTIPAPGVQVPIKFSLTIGAQSYSLTEAFTYTSTAGGIGKGQFNLKKELGSIVDGVFIITKASAIENLPGNGHYFEFDGLLARPLGKAVDLPKTGTCTIKFNEADPVVIPVQNMRQNGTKIVFDQSDRDLGGIRHLMIDVKTRVFVIKTWDIPANIRDGGTDLPLRGKPYTAFNFALRIDFDQVDGTKLQAVTATRLTRRTNDDAFWQTGRRGKKQ
jgi:PKD repeat protein